MDHDSGDERERLTQMWEQKRVEAQRQRQHAQMAQRTRLLRQLLIAAVLLFVVLLAILLLIAWIERP